MDQDDGQDSAQRTKEIESHRGQREERGGKIIPDSAHHREKRVGGKTILVSTHLPFHPPPPLSLPPFQSPAQDQRGGEETASKLTQGPERRRREGEGGS